MDLAILLGRIVHSIYHDIFHLNNVLPHYNSEQEHHLVRTLFPRYQIHLNFLQEFQELTAQLSFVTSSDTRYRFKFIEKGEENCSKGFYFICCGMGIFLK